MRIYGQIIKLIFALFLAKYVADQVMTGSNYTIYALLIAIIYLFFVPWEQKFILFSFFILYPFSFPRNFPMVKYWSDLLAPILFILMMSELLLERKSLFSEKVFLYISAMGIIALWALINYVNTPVAGRTFGATTVEGVGLRNYIVIFTGIITFFLSFWYFRYKEINVGRWLLMLLIFTLVIGNLRMIGIEIPTMGVKFAEINIGGEKGKVYTSISGLRIVALIGISALFALYHKKKAGFIFALIFINCIVFSVFSGGRAMFWGILFAICLYVILIKRKHIFPVLAAIIIAGCMYTLFLPGYDPQESKLGRVFAMEGGLKKQNLMRYYYYLYMWEVFQKSPLFGKGIGYKTISEADEFFNRNEGAREYRVNLEYGLASGSHGSYMSILSTFGIGGLFFITVTVFGSIYYAYKIVKRSSEHNDDAKLALFCFMYMTGMSIHMTTGGDGYSYREMWFLPGIVAAIMAKDQRDKPEILEAEIRGNDLEEKL